MNPTTSRYLSTKVVQRLLEDMPDYVKMALAEKATELECPIEAVVEMAESFA